MVTEFRLRTQTALIALVIAGLAACGGNGGDDASAPPVVASHTWIGAQGMSSIRSGHTATLLTDGRVLIAGGSTSFTRSSSAVLTSAEIYDPTTGQWTETGSMNTPRSQHSATLLSNGKVLVAGGTPDNHDALASAELYDPASGTWAATGTMNFARASQGATLLTNGDVLVAESTLPFAVAETYDPSTGTWTSTSTDGVNGANGGANLLISLPDGRVLAALNGAPEVYDPAANTWTQAGDISTGSEDGPAIFNLTSLKDGTALIAGGSEQQGGVSVDPILLNNAWIYDSSSGMWTATGNLTKARDEAVATLLQDGTVLVFGGASDASAEIYGPSTRSWSATGNMVNGQVVSAPQATLLEDGRVLVTGGAVATGTNPTPIANAQIYTP